MKIFSHSSSTSYYSKLIFNLVLTTLLIFSYQISLIQTLPTASTTTKLIDHKDNELNQGVLIIKDDAIKIETNISGNGSLFSEDKPLIIIATNTSAINETVVSPPPPSQVHQSNFAKFFGRIDKYTLILISAFVVGVLLISCLIALAICICKSVNRINRDTKKKHTETTNPLYDNQYGKDVSPNSLKRNSQYVDYKFEKISNRFIDDDEEENFVKDDTLKRTPIYKGETFADFDTPVSLKKASSNETLTNVNVNIKQPNSTKSSLSSSSASTSFNSSLAKSPISLPSNKNTPSTVKSPEETPLFSKSSQNKSNQQLNNEKRLSVTSIGKRTFTIFNRTTSQTHQNSGVDLRKSVCTSSTSSIQQPQNLNFELIANDIDDMVDGSKKHYLIKQDSSSSNIFKSSQLINVDNENNGANADESTKANKTKSISDIYFDYIKAKREEKQKQTNTPANRIVELKQLDKRHSITNSNSGQIVSFNPNATTKMNASKSNSHLNNSSNLINNESISVETLGSEKSCY